MNLETLLYEQSAQQSSVVDENDSDLWTIIESYYKDILGNKSFKERIKLRTELKELFLIKRKQSINASGS